MTRMEALEAVAEAADELDRLFISGCPYLSQARNKLHQAILAWRRIRTTQGEGCVSAAPTGCVSDSECAAAGRCLERDALPATPGEMVEFSAWEHEDGMIAWYRAGSRHDLIEMSGWTRLGTVRLPLVKETRDAG